MLAPLERTLQLVQSKTVALRFQKLLSSLLKYSTINLAIVLLVEENW